MTTPADPSSKALAVFPFSIYHQLESGDVVTGIVFHDGAGHQVDPTAVDEIVGLGLAEQRDRRLHFTGAGQLMLSQIVDRIRGSW